MALPVADYELYNDYQVEAIATKTWRINEETKRIEGPIDGDEALAQSVELRLRTERGLYDIYSGEYGCDSLINVDKNIRELEIQNNIKEALAADDRIADAKDFKFKYIDKNKIVVYFTLEKNDGGTLNLEVKENGDI